MALLDTVLCSPHCFLLVGCRASLLRRLRQCKIGIDITQHSRLRPACMKHIPPFSINMLHDAIQCVISSTSTHQHTNSLNGQLAKNVVISPTSRVIHLSSDLLITACNSFETMSTTCLMHMTSKPMNICIYRWSV